MLEIAKSPEVIVFLCTCVLAGVIWNIRLEGVVRLHKALFDAKLDSIEKDHAALKAVLDSEIIKREALEKSIREDLTEIKLSLARVAALLEEKLHS
jgi:esterase/lipase